MKQFNPICVVVLTTLLKNINCLIWENLLLDSFTKSEKNYGLNVTEKFLNTTELIKFYGYCAKAYDVRTKDDYILKVIRIQRPGPVVFIMHGFINCADDFVTLGANDSLPFLLADAGYDVWLGNARGNKYSKKHVMLSTKNHLFWNFTFHEIGCYDLPAMIDFALEKANKTQLTYVGHSQGTTAYFIMTSMKPEYCKKVKMMISLATIAWTGNVRSPLARIIATIKDVQYFISNLLGQNEFFPSNDFNRFIYRDFCGATKLSLFLCETFLFLLYGFDYRNVNTVQAPIQLAHFPSGASVKQLQHYLQMIASGQFVQFDNGPIGNMKAYGSKTPPTYPVENITTPIAIIHGTNDYLSHTKDVDTFIKNVPAVFEKYTVPYERWNHMDYLWATEAKKMVYVKIMALIKSRN